MARIEAGDSAMDTITPQEGSTYRFFLFLARRWRLILGVTGAFAVLAIVVCLLTPNEYTAEIIVLPPAQSSSLSSALLSQAGGSAALASLAGSGLGIRNPGETYASLFRTNSLEAAIVNRFHLTDRYHVRYVTEAVRKFEQRSSVNLGVKDGLLRITVSDRDPGFAAEMANGYIDEFRKQSANLAITEASQRRQFFEQQLGDAKGQLENAEQAFKHTEQTTGIVQPDSQARSLIEAAAVLRAQIVTKQVQIQSMLSYATPNNPEVVMAQQQLSALRNQLSRLSGSSEDSDTGVVLPKGKIPEAGLEYLRKYRDVKFAENLYQLLTIQYEVARLDEAREGAGIQVADPAVRPELKSGPHRLIIIFLTTLVGFAVSLLFARFFDIYVIEWRTPEGNRKVRMLREQFSARD
ncbi:MAG: chain length determinant family protein [Acidobacteria bacterium]|nr:chain length determinant family protein [Acidobacteriota bacterium]